MNDVSDAGAAASALEAPHASASRGAWRRAWDSDVAWSFRHSPVAIAAAVVL